MITLNYFFIQYNIHEKFYSLLFSFYNIYPLTSMLCMFLLHPSILYLSSTKTHTCYVSICMYALIYQLFICHLHSYHMSMCRYYLSIICLSYIYADMYICVFMYVQPRVPALFLNCFQPQGIIMLIIVSHTVWCH